MYCTQCGTKNDAGNRFCVGCGIPLSEDFSKEAHQTLPTIQGSSAPEEGEQRQDDLLPKADASSSPQPVIDAVNPTSTDMPGASSSAGITTNKRLIRLAIDAILIVLILLPWIEANYYFGASSFSIPELAVKSIQLSNKMGGLADYGLDDATKAVAGAGIAAGLVWIGAAYLLCVDAHADFKGYESKHSSYAVTAILAIGVIIIVRYVNSSVAEQFGAYSSYAYGVMTEVLKTTPFVWITLACGIAASFYEKWLSKEVLEGPSRNSNENKEGAGTNVVRSSSQFDPESQKLTQKSNNTSFNENGQDNDLKSSMTIVLAVCGALLFGVAIPLLIHSGIVSDQNAGEDPEMTSEAEGNVTLTFMGNGASKGDTSRIQCDAGQEVRLPECGFSRDGYVFDCWEGDDGHQYYPGDIVYPDDDADYWASWIPIDDSEDDSSIRKASAFPKTWTGSYVGYSQYVEGGSTERTVRFVFTDISDSGSIEGICYIGINDPEGGTGSYYVEGYIDWETREISLHGTRWYKQEDVKYMRTFTGTVSYDYSTIAGTCEMSDGTRPGDWTMQSD